MPFLQVSAERRRLYAPGRAAVAAVALLLLATSAEAAGLRAASHEGYGRLVFDFDRATQFQAAIEGDRLVVRFEQPFAARLDPAVRALDGYVPRASPSEDP